MPRGSPSGRDLPILAKAQDDVGAGRFSAVLSRDFLTQVTLNSTFTISTQVSFDEGDTYLPFRVLTLTLRK